jgi:hypothetical protein
VIVWTLVIGLSTSDGEARIAVGQYQSIEQCEAEGKKWAGQLAAMTNKAKVGYTVACAMNDFVLVAQKPRELII